ASANAGDGADFILYGPSLLVRNSVFSGNIDNPDLSAWGFGIYTYTYPLNAPAAITLDNVILNGNDADGAYLVTGGNIMLNKVYAANNLQHGVYISGSYTSNSVGAKNVTVTNSTFTSNQDNNLEIHASGAVKITNLYSTSSGGDGLYVNNHSYNTLLAPVTVLGAVLSGNNLNGVSIASDGTITVAGITANGNGGFGMYLDNWWTGSAGNIIISASLGLNQLNENTGGNGLYAGSFRNISISSVQANRNTYYGIYIGGYGATSNVTLLNVEASGNKGTGAEDAGISITAKGSVLLNKVTAGYNAGNGIYIKNEAGTYSRPVTISNSSANYNGYTGATDNNKKGIYVLSAGQITLSGVTASGNSHTGTYLENT
ncbi:MAG TPA: right-handed parallel beta-helix repeat-containing protein, partial [Anaerolineaceae bacterium]|nr:right-handed parallel beta-helix repeat-containing protein [Anaerolineaceae bacterium]